MAPWQPAKGFIAEVAARGTRVYGRKKKLLRKKIPLKERRERPHCGGRDPLLPNPEVWRYKCAYEKKTDRRTGNRRLNVWGHWSILNPPQMKRHAKPSVTHKPIHKVNLPVKMRYFLTSTIYTDVFTVFMTVFMGRRGQGPPAIVPVFTLDFLAARYDLSLGSVAKHTWTEVNFVCVRKLLRGRKLSWHEIWSVVGLPWRSKMWKIMANSSVT